MQQQQQEQQKMGACTCPIDEPDVQVLEVHEIRTTKIGNYPVAKGEWMALPKAVQKFIAHWIDVTKPRGVYICDGSQAEATEVIHKLEERGLLHKLKKYPNSYVCRTDPADVARVESKTWLCTDDKYQTVPHVREGVQGILGQWKSPEDAFRMCERFRGCMAGRMMYVIPFSMGPIGSPLSKVGIELTDSNYVLLCMRIMTRMSGAVLDLMKKQEEETGSVDFVRCVHSMGSPRPSQRKTINHWPCNPDGIMIGHFPQRKLITSYGSGYGGNSLLGKKCFALRIAMNLARDEGWLAEHMLIMGCTEKKTGKETFIAAAFPSACGKTNMAMLTPSEHVHDYEVKCVGDDIAWMRFDEKGILHGINPEAGFFGVCPGTNMQTNPNAMLACQQDTIFTNVAEMKDGGVFWEGLEKEVDNHIAVTDWLGNPWDFGCQRKAAHPNSRFTASAANCPIIHPKWEDPKGVPISAFLFGGRRPNGVPLIYESFSWEHGVMIGACVKSEATAAAEFTGKKIMHDPMAMRPFMGYNFGNYLKHWLSLNHPPHKMPKIFHVNWFRTDEEGKFLWPGYGENIRVVDWVIRRVNGEEGIAEKSPIGYLPKKGSMNLTGLNIDWDNLFKLSKHYLEEDIQENTKFLQDQVGCDLPERIKAELKEQAKRIECMSD